MPSRRELADGPDRQTKRCHKRGRRALIGVVGAVLLAVMLILAVAAPALAFPDVPSNHAYAPAIDELSSLGIIGGYTNGYFGINDSVKRAQFSKMIVGTLGITPNTSTATRFTDLGDPDGNGYPHRFVQTAYDNGITFGTNAAQTLFAPYNAIRRDQVVSMIVRGANNLYLGSLVTPPAGTPSLFAGVPEPHGANLRIAEYNGLLDGLLGMGASWNVSANATRGEVAQMLYNLLYVLGPSGVLVFEDGSGDYPTIEAAVAAIDSGMTIFLGPGTFYLDETLIADFSFNLVGSGMDGPDATTVTYPSDVVDVMGPVNFSAQDIAFVSTANTVASDVMYVEDGTVDLLRCSFTGGNTWNDLYGSGLSLYGSAYGSAAAAVTDCYFGSNELDGVCVGANSSVSIYGSIMEYNGQNGVGFYDNAAGIVDQSDCTSNALHGVSVNDYSEVTVQNSICSDNGTGGGDYASGIYFEDDSVGTVQNCVCNENLIDGISCHDYADVTVSQSTCNYNREDGITFSEYVTGSISFCECSNNLGYDGIDVHDDAYADVDNNLCVNNPEAGIWFGDNADGTISNNECAYNYYGLLIDLSSNPFEAGNNYLHDNFVDYRNDIVWASIAASGSLRAR
jgi:parallel beta-helix repeat protein